MSAILRQREIVDRRALQVELDALAEGGEPPRARVAEVLRRALQAGRAEVRKRFEAGASGTDTTHELAFLVDQLIRVLYDFVATRVYPLANPDRRRAHGAGRGRRLWPRRAGALLRHRSAVPAALQADAAYRAGGGVHALSLWDLGLKVGQATRSVEEMPAPRQGRPHHPHRACSRRATSGASRSCSSELKRRFEAEIVKGTRRRIRRGQARRARRAARAPRRFALCRRAQRQGGQGRPARPPHAVLDRQIHLPRRRRRRAGRARRAVAPRRRSASRARRTSCGRCAAICISSPAAPRTA